MNHDIWTHVISQPWARGGAAPLEEVADHYAIALLAVVAHRDLDARYFEARARVRLGNAYDLEPVPGEKLGDSVARMEGAIDAMRHETRIVELQDRVWDSAIRGLFRDAARGRQVGDDDANASRF